MPNELKFDDASGRQVKINYSIPLPGQISGRRIVQLDLGLDNAHFTDAAKEVEETYAQSAGVTTTAAGVEVNAGKAVNFLRERLVSMGHDAGNVERAVSALPRLLDARLSRAGAAIGEVAKPDDDDGVVADPVLGDPRDLVKAFADKAVLGVVAVPTTTGGGGGTVTDVPAEDDQAPPPPEPQLFVIETYGISSALGEYGMGRTVRTFSLLPGESTTIRLKTWQSTKESIKSASSIIDSHEQSAKERFAKTVQDESTDKKTKSKSLKWSVEAQAKASWGWGSASLKASASGEHHSSREQFARSASEAVSEHSRDASSKRELSLTSSSETSREIGNETNIERVISNVNMRRVLNFVFRELNQTYTTMLHLKDIKIAFSNGSPTSWREVPVSGLHSLLSELVVGAKVDETAMKILKAVGTVFNNEDLPVRTIETIDYDPQTEAITISAPVLDNQGNFPAPTPKRFYRLRRGPLEQGGSESPVDGVLMSKQTIVMRTDSVIVEALLGQQDALDSYAMEIQEAAAGRETLENERLTLLLSTLSQIQDPEARAKAAARLFSPQDGGE
ncbi:MAG: hypothetical protein EP341_00460 [Sphingomonadales bacterium]|nr:MAG: hypothetical protein EP341_00460 [Sphingomonadales bacterium]